jgi:hypothetical protein
VCASRAAAGASSYTFVTTLERYGPIEAVEAMGRVNFLPSASRQNTIPKCRLDILKSQMSAFLPIWILPKCS